MSKVLVTGGAGYIGCHTVRSLREAGHSVCVVDDLSKGHAGAVPADVPLHVFNLHERERLRSVMADFRPEAVVHFAAHSYVGESVTNPRKYFEDNLGVTLNLLGAMLDASCPCFVLSSTAATYGDPVEIPMRETHPQNPVNPYGETKLFLERILNRYREAYGLRYATLRYFNAAGAHPDGTLGESHDPETHLIPLMARAILDDSYTLNVFGDDYPTPDGTCIRDYVHVLDLADAHLRAMERLWSGQGELVLNLGTGTGFSVMEMIRRFESVAGRPMKRLLGPRRPGDPPSLVASGEKARQLLGWECRHSSIDTILETAWQWHCRPAY